MNPSSPIDAPEYTSGSGHLTPVSPKPVHYPAPANIPVLERQMDPVFNDTLTHLGYGTGSQANMETAGQQATSDPYNLPEQIFADLQQPPFAEKGPQEDNGYGFAQAMSPTKVDQSTINQDSYTANSSYIISNQDSSTSNHHTADGASYSFNPFPTSNGISVNGQPTAPLSHVMSMVTETAPDTAYGGEGDAASYTKDEAEVTHEGEGGVDFETILDKLSPSTAGVPVADGPTNATAASQSINTQIPSSSNLAGNSMSPLAALPSNPNLPPRPPPQEKPATHPNYAPEDDIRSYHPHPQNPNGPNAPHHIAGAYRPNPGVQPRSNVNIPPALNPPGVAANAVSASGINPPPGTTLQQPSPQLQISPLSPQYRQRDSLERPQSQQDNEDEEVQLTPDVQKIYDQFLHDERVYVSEGSWDKFPPNSRLFIGNLPSEKVTKRDVFHKFYRYGKLAQISIKQAYGFVQFLDAQACYTALHEEQDTTLRGRKIHLEISKPQGQKGTKDTQQGRGRNRRSRSPDYTRGGTGASKQQDRGSQRNERLRGRDGYRPMRSPSPLRGYRNGRGARSPDRRDSWRRSRSRSRSPHGRWRAASPRRSFEDDLPLPHRDPKDVPDVQIMVVETLDQDFLRWVENGFRSKGVRVDVLILSPRLSEPKVVERQILEGVLAICRLTRLNQQTGKIPLKMFKRIPGAAEVAYDDYDNLDPSICADLVNRAKQMKNAPPQAQYNIPPAVFGAAQYGMPSQQQPQPPSTQLQFQPPQQVPGGAPNLASIMTSLDANSLQKLLGAMQQAPQTPQTPVHAVHQTQQSQGGISSDLARLLSGVQQPQAQNQQAPYQQQQHPFYQQQQPQAPQQQNAFNALASNPSLASLLGAAGLAQQQPQQHMSAQQPSMQQGPTPSQQPTPDMQQIMAQLSRYRQ